MLHGRFACRQRGVLELKLPGRTNRGRAEQFLLQQRPSLYRRQRRAVVLQWKCRQRQMPTAAAAKIDLSKRLRNDRRCLLPGRSGDLGRSVLSERANAERT